MAEEGLVKKLKMGDITFGVPVGIELLNQPYGFYEFLGVKREATTDEIRKAYKKMAVRMHPDHGGTTEGFQSLERVASILLDDGDGLGEEHSRRRHYDAVSDYDSFFEGFIQIGEERTRKLSEILLMQMEGDKKRAEFDREIEEKAPGFMELKAKLGRARSDDSKARIMEDMQQKVYEAREMTPDMIEQMKDTIKEIRERVIEEAQKFIQSLRKSPKEYLGKVADIFYLGQGTLTFCDYRAQMQIAGHEVEDNILRLILGGDNYLKGFSQVHVKAEEGNIRLEDHNVRGIVQVVKGTVAVDYESSTYGEVIRARAPDVYNMQGFEQHGDLYIPSRFAVGEWWEKAPALDVAVKEGTITLELHSPKIGKGLDKYLIGSNNLESILNKNYISKKIL
ncbi:DnaJ domain-containing protein [Candidatus Woesearchaeota archaeon]|nr:DnaJ domain-containing protein [Candidatus Woesearchaeota archaeon]